MGEPPPAKPATATAPPRTTWLARHFGWSGSRGEWLMLLGIVAWLTVGGVLWVKASNFSPARAIVVGLIWLLSFVLVANDTVRKLFGPVFFYDALRIGRRSLTLWLVFGYVAIAGFFLVTSYLSFLSEKCDYFDNPNPIITTGDYAQFGNHFFQMFCVMQFAAVTLLTPVYISGTICVEKERKTLEFLFATDLRNTEIIFGKLAARVANLLLFVLAGLPILSFLQLFGGVDPEQVIAATVATITTVIGLAAIGTWLSVYMRKARDAILFTYIIYILYSLGTLYIAAWLNLAPPGWWRQSITLFGYTIGTDDLGAMSANGNILWQLVRVFNGARLGTISLVDIMREYVGFWAFVCFVLLGTSMLRLRVVALRQAYGPSGGTKTRKKKLVTKDGQTESVPVNVVAREVPPIGDNPMFWKEVFVDGRARKGWIFTIMTGIGLAFAVVSLVIIIYNMFIEPSGWTSNGSFAQRWSEFQNETNMWMRIVTGVATAVFLLNAAIRGAGAISGERDKDTWISLIASPLDSDRIVWGKFWGCILGQRRGYALLMVAWAFTLLVGGVGLGMLTLTALLIFLYLCAFSWLGLLCSMTARNTLIASIRGFFAAVFALGGFWLVLLVCCCLPIELVIRREPHLLTPFMQITAAATPPFMAGVMPMHTFDRWDKGPFADEETHGIGMIAIVFGTLIWVVITPLLGWLCHYRFRILTNQQPQHLRIHGLPLPPPQATPANGTLPNPPEVDRGEPRD